MRAHMGTLAHAHKWDGQQSISAAQSLPPSFVRRATLGAALSPPIRTDDDVAVKLVGREKISKKEMYGMDWRTEREETTTKFVREPGSSDLDSFLKGKFEEIKR